MGTIVDACLKIADPGLVLGILYACEYHQKLFWSTESRVACKHGHVWPKNQTKINIKETERKWEKKSGRESKVKMYPDRNQTSKQYLLGWRVFESPPAFPVVFKRSCITWPKGMKEGIIGTKSSDQQKSRLVFD